VVEANPQQAEHEGDGHDQVHDRGGDVEGGAELGKGESHGGRDQVEGAERQPGPGDHPYERLRCAP
jgi:hypothetical protein